MIEPDLHVVDVENTVVFTTTVATAPTEGGGVTTVTVTSVLFTNDACNTSATKLTVELYDV
jgi:hypothetical protein